MQDDYRDHVYYHDCDLNDGHDEDHDSCTDEYDADRTFDCDVMMKCKIVVEAKLVVTDLPQSPARHRCFIPSNTRLKILVGSKTSKGRHKKNRFFLGKSPKQWTPSTHRYGLGLT